jgi:hypothetical protein
MSGNSFHWLRHTKKPVGKLSRYRRNGRDWDDLIAPRFASRDTNFGELQVNIGSGYLMTEPDRLQFSYDAFGKPQLANKRAFVSFSISHSDDWGCWVSRAAIELESIWSAFTPKSTQRIWRSDFSRQTNFENRVPCRWISNGKAFYCDWTRKEAYLKGREKAFPMGWTALK